jgi:outer membrane protein assembly factor BamB
LGGINIRKPIASVVVLLFIVSSLIPMAIGLHTPDVDNGLMDSAWPMFGQNLRRTGRSPYGKSGNAGVMKWRTPWIGQTVSSPAIADDGTVYIGTLTATSTGGLFAINPDGSEKWSFNAWWIISSPAICEDGTIYFGCNDGILYAINSNGTEKWKCNIGRWVSSSPVIDNDGTVYVGSTNNKFYAIHPNGTIKWSYTTGFKIYSSAAIDNNGIIYIGSHDGHLYALNPNGTLKWKFDTSDEIKSVPTIGNDGTIFVGSWDGKLYAINPNGTLQWEFQTGESIDSSPTIASDGTIYIGSYNGLIFSISSDGNENWRYQTNNWILSSAAIDKYGVIYFGSMDGYLYVFNPDGSLKWKYRGSGGIEASPAIAEDGTIYIGSGNYLHAIEVIDDYPPDVPTIDGPTTVRKGENHTYEVVSSDSDGDNISYLINWGDNTNTGWIGPYNSGETIIVNHSWYEKGTYEIRVVAKDSYGAESDWATLEVSMPKTKAISSPFIQYLENHPRLFPILRLIIRV